MRQISLARFAGALLCAVVGGVSAQTALPIPHVQLSAGATVYTVARLADGSLVFAGDFSSVDGVPRANIAKLRPDGSLDPDWNPVADDVIYVVVERGGAIYAAGRFSNIGGQQRQRIAKLSANGTGGADIAWDPSANGAVNAIALDASGNVYVSGWYTHIGGQDRNRIAKLAGNGTGAADINWNPSADAVVFRLALDASGDVYAGGWFTHIGGQARNYLAKLSGAGTGAADPSWNPSPDSGVASIALDAAGNLFVGGDFLNIDSQAHARIAKLSSSTGAAEAAWNPSANATVFAVAPSAGGNVYVSGYFSSVSGESRSNIARLSGNGVADANWNPSPNGIVYALSLGASGDVIAAGTFSNVGLQGRTGIVALPPDNERIFGDGFQ